MTTGEKYYSRNMLNFTQQTQASVSQNQKVFSGFFIAFLKCALNLQHLEKKDEYPRLVTSKLIGWEKNGYINV